LLNTSTAVRYLAVDVLPSADIIAEDGDTDGSGGGNTIVASGSQLNAASPHLTQITILTSGDLTASSEGNPDPDLLVAGTKDQLVSKYRFHGQDEDFQVKKLTIVNDLAGNFGDADVLTSAISKVTIKYTDVNGVQKSASSSLSGTGEAKFAGLDFFVPAGEDAFLEVYVDVNTKALVGESISGKTFRLGLQNTGNSITTFEAIGQSSSTNLNFTGAPTTKVTNSANVNGFVVRTSVPTFANVSASTSLAGGEKTLMSFSITADKAGSVSFGRLVFDIDIADADAGGELTVGSFKFYRGSTLVTAANVYGSVDGDLAAQDVSTDQAVIVSFNQEESVSAGSSQTYSLKASVAGVQTDDSIDTKISIGDENTPVTGVANVTLNGNTGYVFDNTSYNMAAGTFAAFTTDVNAASVLAVGNTISIYDNSAAAIVQCTIATVPANTTTTDVTTDCATTAVQTADFVVNALLAASATQFRGTATTARNIIWSDKSADVHTYPTVAAGSVTTTTGSYDWTNGYLLDITNLQSHNLQKN